MHVIMYPSASDRRQGLAVSLDTRQHHSVPKLQERRLEEIIVREKDRRFPAIPGTTMRFPNYKKHHPVPKPQQRKQEEIMMEKEEVVTGAMDWQFPGTLGIGTTIQFPSHKTRDKSGTTIRFPSYKAGENGRL